MGKTRFYAEGEYRRYFLGILLQVGSRWRNVVKLFKNDEKPKIGMRVQVYWPME